MPALTLPWLSWLLPVMVGSGSAPEDLRYSQRSAAKRTSVRSNSSPVCWPTRTGKLGHRHELAAARIAQCLEPRFGALGGSRLVGNSHPDRRRRLRADSMHPEGGEETDRSLRHAHARHGQRIVLGRLGIGPVIEASTDAFDHPLPQQQWKLVVAHAGLFKLPQAKKRTETRLVE